MQFLIKSAFQAGAALLLATVCWGLHRLVAGLRGRRPERWSVWLGLTQPPSLRLGLVLFAAFLAIGALVAVLSQALVPGHDALARESPQWAIAEQPLAGLLLAAPAYAFLMTGFSEELLFRGVLAKRLIYWLGLRIGNLAQAALFALLHVVIVHAAVPGPGWALVAFAALFPGAMAWLLAWAMVRDDGSLFAPWLAHSAVNLSTILAYLAMARSAGPT